MTSTIPVLGRFQVPPYWLATKLAERAKPQGGHWVKMQFSVRHKALDAPAPPSLLWLFPGALHDAVGAHSTVFMTLSDPGSSLWLPVIAREAKLC